MPIKLLDKQSSEKRYCLSALAHGLKYYSQVFPNPPVGAIIVKNGKVLARGAHERAGLAHAEVNAIRGAGKESKDSDLYVSLEPCNHFGRTPPCTKFILESGIKRVFYLFQDNSKASGGADFLREQGVEVHWVEPTNKILEYILPWSIYAKDGVISLTPVIFLDLGGRVMNSSQNGLKKILKRTQKFVDAVIKPTELDAYDVAFMVHNESSLSQFIEMEKDTKIRIKKVIIVRAMQYMQQASNSPSDAIAGIVLKTLGGAKLSKAQFFQGMCIEEYTKSHV